MVKTNKTPACNSPLPNYNEEEFPPLNNEPKEIMFKRYVTVKHTDENIKMSDLNPFEVDRKLKMVLGKKHTCKVSTIRPGLLLIEVDRRPIYDKLLTTKKIGDIPVIVEEHQALNSSMGTIYCDNSEIKKMTPDQIKDELANQDVIKVHRMQKKDTQQVGGYIPTNLYVITFSKPILPKEVKIGYLKVDVICMFPTLGGALIANGMVMAKTNVLVRPYVPLVAKAVMSTVQMSVAKLKSAFTVSRSMRQHLKNALCGN